MIGIKEYGRILWRRRWFGFYAPFPDMQAERPVLTGELEGGAATCECTARRVDQVPAGEEIASPGIAPLS